MDEFFLKKPFGYRKNDDNLNHYLNQYPRIIRRVEAINLANSPGYQKEIYDIVKGKAPLYLEIRLSKNIIKKIKNGAKIKSIHILPPNDPDGHVHCNIYLTGPEDVMHSSPQIKNKSVVSNVEAMGIDMNRLSSWRAISFGLLEKSNDQEEKLVSLEINNAKDIDECEKSLPDLLNCNVDSRILKKIKNSLKQRIEARKERIKNKRENERNINNGTKEYEKTIHDILGAPVVYWDVKLKHLENHIGKIQKAFSQSKEKGKKKRLAGEITLLHHRRETIRNEIKNYLQRTLFYMICYYNPKIVSYENLRSMGTKGTKKHFAKLILRMIKRMGSPYYYDEGSIIYIVNKWCEKNGINVTFQEVNARYTSKIHFNCINKKNGRISRTSDWDFGKCKECKETDIDTHINAGFNIALLGYCKHNGFDPPPFFTS